jgi:hypothetical protein
MTITLSLQFNIKYLTVGQTTSTLIKTLGSNADGELQGLPEGATVEEQSVVPAGSLTFSAIPEDDDYLDSNGNTWTSVN